MNDYSPYESDYIRLRNRRDELCGLKRKPRPVNNWNRCGSSRTKRTVAEATKPGHKICNRCGVEKPHAAFYRNINCRDGHQGHCIACHKARQAKPKGESHVQAKNI